MYGFSNNNGSIIWKGEVRDFGYFLIVGIFALLIPMWIYFIIHCGDTLNDASEVKKNRF